MSIFIILSQKPARVRGSLDVCLDYLQTSAERLDLLAGDISLDVQSGCPDSQCLPQSSFTFAGNDSFLQFSVESQTIDYLKLSLELQTRSASSFLALSPFSFSLKKDHKNQSCYNINYFVDLQLFIEKDSCINESLTFCLQCA